MELIGIALIAIAIRVLFADPSVGDGKPKKKDTKGTKAVKVVKRATASQPGAPKPSQDLWGWLTYNGKK